MKKSNNAGGVVVNKIKQVIVVSQKGTSWSLPKGHVRNNESNLNAAKREIYEETGIKDKDLELIRELDIYQRYKTSNDGKSEDKTEFKTIHMFLFHSEQKILRPIDPINPEARWIPKEKVADLLTHQKDKEFFLKIINKI